MEKTNSSLKTKRRQQVRKLAFWTLLWVLTEALVVFGHLGLWGGLGWLTALLLGVNILMGLAMVFAYRDLMNLLDELERKIQLESMGITLGLTLVAGVGYSVLDITNLIPWDAEIGNLVFFMAICYIASILINTRRYS
jgi:hypothetical protein